MITVACIWLFYKYGISSYSALFWLKIVTLGLIYYFVKKYKSKEIYYYQNLGISKTTLWVSTLAIDFCIFIGSLILTYHFR
jgi:type III secretory pathway component EscU